MPRPDLLPPRVRPCTFTAPVSPSRDRRIDILRGIAVLGISANHVMFESTAGAGLTPYAFGHFFSFDFADVFTLLSGIVAGLVFFPLLVQQGASRCFQKATRRAAQIWAAQILCALAALSILLVFEQGTGLRSPALSPGGGAALNAAAGNVFLYSPSMLLDILPVYIFLLLALPAALILFRRSIRLYFALTVSLWAVIWGPAFLSGAGLISLPRDSLASPYFVHPLCGQLLFFTGVAIGVRKQETEAFLLRHRSAVLCAATAFLLATNFMSQVGWMVHHADQKQFAGPLRLAELLAVISVLWCLTGAQSQVPAALRRIEACGRHILPVFAITTLGAVFFSCVIIWLDAGRLLYGLCILANTGLCLISGHLLETRRSAGASVRQHAPADPAAFGLRAT